MKIRSCTAHKGDLILSIVDKNSKFLGMFIISDPELIKSLKHTDLGGVSLEFK